MIIVMLVLLLSQGNNELKFKAMRVDTMENCITQLPQVQAAMPRGARVMCVELGDDDDQEDEYQPSLGTNHSIPHKTGFRNADVSSLRRA